ncbi:hypothetical protein VST7929_01205 [Vibrio stylophorae]|uniref:Uncharacterized protein n=1 Tax=Vibrio stylophorae TaxID=659351 RepID=A0ABN8DX55_9VIBR|nr:hypothetical protein [Vibrio stylophorae]CAH0533339.1 hypothetical protein VST7929_01205 [Vibrio stylophorae]
MPETAACGYKQYTECLNDLMDYFILTDIEGLTTYQEEEGLQADLLTEFTSNESGDCAVESGVMVPLAGIENYPYILYFNLGVHSVFEQRHSDLQHRQSGYVLQVVSGRVYLLTMPLLRDWPTLSAVVVAHKPYLDIANGWYQVTVHIGETQQESGWEPTLEFMFEPVAQKPALKADINYRYGIDAREY